MRFYVYYHMKRFLTRPRLMDTFLTPSDIKTIRDNIPIRKEWTTKHKQTKELISIFLNEKKKEGKEVRSARYYGMGYGGVVGIRYEEVTKITNQSDEDWKKFIQSDTFGIMQKGQLLLQKAIESYVYSVLGAQVSLGWVMSGKVVNLSRRNKLFVKL